MFLSTTNKPIKTAHVGLGPIGIRIAEMTSELDSAEIVAAIDKADSLQGARLIDIAKVGQGSELTVQQDVEQALQASDADVAFWATSSHLTTLLPQLQAAAKAGVNVISTSEELMYPWRSNRETAEQIDRLAKDAGISILGLGVNPGFVMDQLPLFASSASTKVQAIAITRRVDLRTRRQQLRDKMAVGRSIADFEASKSSLGHVGLKESLDLVCTRLGWEIESPTHTLNAIVAKSDGTVAGLSEKIIGSDQNGRELSLTLEMSIEFDEPADTVSIEGTPSIQITVPGGFAGDDATAAIAINYLDLVTKAAPGLITVDQLPAPGTLS